MMEYVTLTGENIASVFDDLAALRISVFREFPYLYEGTVSYEKKYLQTYADASEAFLFAVYDQGKMIGATTAIPLIDETPEVQAPFQAQGYNLEHIFYFGESVLLPAYRGKGLGHRFFDERENYARALERFELTCFCAVERPDDHPLKPANYRPNDAFWQKRGYHLSTNLVSEFSWPDIGEKEDSVKKMKYWWRKLR